MKEKSKDYPGKDTNRDLIFESPQNEESKRLANEDTKKPAERKDKNPDDKGHKRGGNQSVNQE
jgi:hypothetical protein